MPGIHDNIEDCRPDFITLTESWSPTKSIMAYITNNIYTYKYLDIIEGICGGVSTLILIIFLNSKGNFTRQYITF